MIENELRQVIEEGEGYKIEFKESLANLDKELVAEAGLPPVEFEVGTFFTVIFQRKKAEAITEIFGAKFSENFSLKGKQLDRMVSIIIRGAQDRQVCAYRKRKTDDRGLGGMIEYMAIKGGGLDERFTVS